MVSARCSKCPRVLVVPIESVPFLCGACVQQELQERSCSTEAATVDEDSAGDFSIAQQYEEAYAVYSAMAKKLDEHFLPRIHELLTDRQHDEARAVFRRIPSESVTKVFALDAFRQAGVKPYPG